MPTLRKFAAPGEGYTSVMRVAAKYPGGGGGSMTSCKKSNLPNGRPAGGQPAIMQAARQCCLLSLP